MWKSNEIKEYSKQLAQSISKGEMTIEEAVIKSSNKTGCNKDFARKILNECLKSGYSNNPDYVGDWFGKGQIDFNAIINPEDSGDVYMVKMWSGSGYVLDVYLCKATNIYDAMDIVFNWSWEHEGENNIVFDFDYVRNEVAEYYKSEPDMFGENIDEEEFEDLFISEYYVSNDYSLFARSENFFVDKVPENVIAENQKPIENSRRPIKSSVNFFNDYGTGVYCAVSSNGYTFCYCPLSWINKKGIEDIIGWSILDDKAHYIDGYSWENKTDEEIKNSIIDFESLIRKYAGEDADEIIRNFRSTLDEDSEKHISNSFMSVKSGCNGKSKKGKKRPVKSGLLDEAKGLLDEAKGLIEMIYDDLQRYFRDYGFDDVDFEGIDDTKARVMFRGWHEYDIDQFYKNITNISHYFSNEVVPIWFTMDVINGGSCELVVNVESPM